MATIAEVEANDTNKTNRNESQSVDITVRIGIFFDGTNNNRAQVMMGRLAREKKGGTSQEENNEILATMNIDKLDVIERSYIENSEDKIQAKRKVLKFRNWLRPGMPRTMMQNVGFTNVAILERFYQPIDQADYIYKVYVTGSVAGLAAGQGSTGVVQKIWDAMDAIYTKINFVNFDKSISGVNYVFDVFGFSRGATEARLFVDLCCNREGRPPVLLKGIKRYNRLFSNKENNSEKQIKFPLQKENGIKFNVGIYDTVASVGVIRNPQWAPAALSESVTGIELVSKTASTFHDENVADLGLNTVAYDESVKKVIHICALDEYRENFALCALPNGGKVEQFFMPGIHTDIGGSELEGYRGKLSIPVIIKKKQLIVEPSVYNEAPITNCIHERLRLPRVAPLKDCVEMTVENLKHLGWLKDFSNTPQDINQIDVIIDNDGFELLEFKDDDSLDSIDVDRYSIGVFSNLTLAIMAEKHSDVFKDLIMIKGKHAIPDNLPMSYDDMKETWEGCNSNFGHCYFPKAEKDYQDLRLRYLHFSSSASSVNGPHYNDDFCYERLLYTEKGTETLIGN